MSSKTSKTSQLAIPVTEEQADMFLFGEDPGEWEAFCAGWQHFSADQFNEPEPHAKELGLYPENQNLRISWERGWLAARGAMSVWRRP